MSRGIVEYIPGHEGYKCGYCKGTNTSYSHGMWAHTLTPYDYQNLIDRGWRRSGKYCYKPTLNVTCCPLYTIRCEATKFSVSKSQKKVLKKVHRFLAFDYQGKQSQSPENKEQQEMEGVEFSPDVDVQNLKGIKNLKPIKLSDVETVESDKSNVSSSEKVQSSPKISQSLQSSTVSPGPSPKKSNIETTSPFRCKKAKTVRQEKKLQKLLEKGISPEVAAESLKKSVSQRKSLDDFFNEPFPEKPAHKLELRLVVNGDEQYEASLQESFQLYKKYQMSIHNDLEEECDYETYTNFLLETPLEPFEETGNAKQAYGSFHHQYWLDNKLIAVGVLDILPYCVSSVYFYYDPDYSFLSLGTYAALREIALTRELNTQHSDLQYYYMGFYIHSCIKMRYKGQFSPSHLLCPETYTFHPIEKCKPKLEESKYQRFEEDSTIEDFDGNVNLKEVLILHNRKKITYHLYRLANTSSNDESEVQEYATFVGQKCYKRMLLYRA